MKPAPSVELDTLEPASLDQFTTEMIQAGFEPVPNTNRRVWEGPISPSFADLTSAGTMRIRFRDGWPYAHPYLYVDGLRAEHLNAEGVVCLWREDDTSRAWLTFAGVEQRIAAWCERVRTGFSPQDLVLDAYLAYSRTASTLATFDPTQIRPGEFTDGQHGKIYGHEKHSGLIELHPQPQEKDTLRGCWYYRRHVEIPPRTLNEFRGSLARGQRTNLDRGLKRAREGHPDGLDLAMLLWHREDRLDVLVIRLKIVSGDLKSTALRPAPVDEASFLARAGADAVELRAFRVVLFGCGTIGSPAALLACTSGVGDLHLVDGGVLRPGNVVRHAAGLPFIGLPKAMAVERIAKHHAPWVSIRSTPESPMSPGKVAQHIREADLALDMTGHAPFIDIVCRVAEIEQTPLVSAALFRSGAIGRVRRQIPGEDTPMYRRADDSRFPVIPAEESEDFSLEIGCSAPVNRAPPHASGAVAALAVGVVIDTLLGRRNYAEETLEVYRPLAFPPFDVLGRVRWSRLGA